jgi:hypothetical protein
MLIVIKEAMSLPLFHLAPECSLPLRSRRGPSGSRRCFVPRLRYGEHPLAARVDS